MIVHGEDSLLPRQPDLSDLVGLRVVSVEEIVTQEQVVVTFDNGWQLKATSSEWLTVQIEQEPQAKPTTAGA